MTRQLFFNKNLLYFGIPLFLLTAAILFIKSPYFLTNDKLILAVSIDLLITIPLVYFLLIRKTKIPRISVVPFNVIGLIIGIYILPEENQTYIELLANWVPPVLGGFIAIFLITKVRKDLKVYKKEKGTSNDFQDADRMACVQGINGKITV